MRNLKRALSLALASVMLMGMMVVGSSAASFPDVDDENNVEAIAVLEAVKVMIGNEKGDFEPDKNVTRNEMAVIMAKLILGTYEADSYVGSHPFNDVPDWAQRYVAACYNSGIIAGRSDTTYDGNSTVTAVEAAAMMLRALGYEDLSKGAAQWDQPVAAKANEINLFKGLGGNSKTPMVRDSVAKLALNTLQADVVITEKEGDIEIPGTIVIPGKISYKVVQSSDRYASAIDGIEGTDQNNNVQLGEKLYKGDLKKNTKSSDDFSRPATEWTYKGREVIKAVNDADETYTKAVKLSDIYKDLGLGKAVPADQVDFSRNGKEEDVATKIVDTKGNALDTLGLSKSTDNKIGGKGVLTQVWYNAEENTAIVTMIDTYVGKINTVVKATSSADRYVKVGTTSYGSLTTLNNKFETEAFDTDDLVIFTAAYNGSKYDIKSMEALELTATEVLTRWEGSNVVDSDKGNSDSKFTAGETYEYSQNSLIVDEDGAVLTNGIADFKVDESEINIYTDKYGYAIYVSGVESEKNYAAVIGVGSSNTHGSETKGVTLLLADGTQKVVTAKSDDWDAMSVIDHSGSYGASDLKAMGDDPAPDDNHKNLVDDGVADLVTYSIGSDGIYKLTLLGKKPLTSSSDSTKTTTVYSGKYDMTADSRSSGGNVSFVNGKSLLEMTSLYDGTYSGGGSETAYGTSVAANATPKNYYTTSKTIFMVATQKDTTAGEECKGRNYNVYVGYENAPSFVTATDEIHGMAFATNKQYTSQIDVVYIDAVKMAGAGADTYFVKDGSDIITTSDGKYYKLPAVIKGELTEILIDAEAKADWNGTGSMNLEFANKGVYAIENMVKNSKDIIESCSLTAFHINPSNYGIGTVKDRNDVLGIGTTLGGATQYWSYTSDVNVYYVDKDWNISEVKMSDIQTDVDDRVYAMFDDNTASDRTKKLTHIFVCEYEPSIYAVGASANVQFSTDGTNWSNSLSGLTSADTIYIKAAAGYKVTAAAVSALGLTSDGNGIYHVAAKDISAGAVATEVDVSAYADGVNSSAVNASNLELNSTNVTIATNGAMTLPVVDGLSIPDQAKTALKALGYTDITNKSNDGETYTFATKDKDGFARDITVKYAGGDETTEVWYPVTVNGGTTPIAYIKTGTGATVTVNKPTTNAGTGLMNGAAYEDYDTNNEYTVTGADNAVDIKTGYRKVTLTVSDAQLAAAFTVKYAIGDGAFDAAAPSAVKVGDVLKIQLVAGASGVTLVGTTSNATLNTGAKATGVAVAYLTTTTDTGSFAEGNSNVWTAAAASAAMKENDTITITYEAMADGTTALTIAPDWTDAA